MRKYHAVTLKNKTDKYQNPSIPSSYGNIFLKPGDTTVEIPYDDEWGLTGEEKITQLVKDNPDMVEVVTKKFRCKVLDPANDSELINEEVAEGTQWNPQPTKEGHTLEGLYEEKGLTTKVETPIDVSGDTTLYAKFEINQYTCKIMDGRRALVTEKVNHGSSLNPTVEKEGYTLEGIYSESGFKNKVNTPFSNITADTTYYAKFTPNA